MLPLSTQRWPAWGLTPFLKFVSAFVFVDFYGNIKAVTVDFNLLSISDDWFSGAVKSKSEILVFFSRQVFSANSLSYWKNEETQAVTFLMIPSQLEVNIYSDASYSTPLPPWGMTNLQDANVTQINFRHFYQDTNKQLILFFPPSWLLCSFSNSKNI